MIMPEIAEKLKKLLLENTGIRQTIFKNTFWLALAEAITGLLRFFLLIYVTRILGATEYGKFTFALSFVSLLAIVSDLGVIDIATREFSRDKNKEKEFSRFLALDVFLSAIALVLMLAGSFLITSDPIIQKTIWVLSFFILPHPLSFLKTYLTPPQTPFKKTARLLQNSLVLSP